MGQHSTIQMGHPSPASMASKRPAGDEPKPRRRRRVRRRKPETPASLPLEIPEEFVALTVKATGIHPATSRAVALDALVMNAQGQLIDEYFGLVNPGIDPGPPHLHGFLPSDLDEARTFGQALKKLSPLIEGRTVVVHGSEAQWGFIVSEARREASNLARSQGRSRRRRPSLAPRPAAIVDTLATLYRQGSFMQDTRIRAIARNRGFKSTPPKASVERAKENPEISVREETQLLAQLYQNLRNPVAYHPAALRSDKFGMQRTQIRINAIQAAPRFDNPGLFQGTLRQGMEVVITPELQIDPDIVITKILDKGLFYSEKITRSSSVVICNKQHNLLGKAMHAQRKGIPILSDAQFLELAEHTAPGTLLTTHMKR